MSRRQSATAKRSRAVSLAPDARQSAISEFLRRRAFTILASVALVYAFFAGLTTIGDMDLGWQLATGRWVIQNHGLPSTDVLSYTAHGNEWIYPLLSQVLLYCLFRVGGYALLSWVGAIASVIVVAILLRKGRATMAALAIIAVPMIAWRTHPRAEMFTEVLFAAFVSILWYYHQTGRGPLWSLPVMMAFWVNLHLGFIAGLAMCGAYLLLECEGLTSELARGEAVVRLRRAAPWLAITALATLLNPWGPRLYVAIVRQNAILRIHSRWIEEWAQARLTTASILELFRWRGPESAFLWLLVAAGIAIVVSLYQRRFAPALVLAASVFAVIHAVRLQGPFSSIVVVIGGAILADAIAYFVAKYSISAQTLALTAAAATLLITGLVAVRISDLVTNRTYMKSSANMVAFGAGHFPLFPEEAAEFVQHERLPRNILNDFNSGGFLTWSIGPAYPVYIDGRSVPFGPDIFLKLEQLFDESPDSPDWQREADAQNINTVVFSLDHVIGGGLASLDKFCASRDWRPVFMDPYGAVFLRVTPENAGLIERLGLDCGKIQFDAPPTGTGERARAEQFRYYLNAASILVVLGRHAEALHQLDKAQAIFDESPYLHYARGSALQAMGDNTEAERELRTAFELGSDDAPYALARIYDQQERYIDEAKVLGEAAEKSAHPHWLYLRLGFAQLAMGQRQDALRSFDKAEKESPFIHEAGTLGEEFRTQLKEGRRLASIAN